MKILYVITKANWGGAQKYVFDLAEASAKEGFEVVVAYGQPGELGKRLRGAKIRTIEIPTLRRDVETGSEFSSFGTLREIFKEEKPDIVHLNSSKAGGLGALAARLSGVKKIIFTAHGWAFNEDRPLWQRFLIGVLHYMTVFLAHRTICVSDATCRDIAWMPLIRSKLKVIKLGITEPDFKERDEARSLLLPKVENGFIVGMISELHRTKGVGEVLEAFTLIQKSIPDALLVIMGEGQEREKLERKIEERGLSKCVFLLGHVTDAATYLKAYDVFLFPSYTEALGYALLEAGFAGLPSVGTNVGGIPEIIKNEETGLLVERGNITQIVQAIEKLEDDPLLRRRLGETLRTKVSTEFALEKMTRDTLQFYRS